MRRTKPTNRYGATPGKLALIGVLAVVLAIVIVRQLPDRTKKNLAAQPAANASSQKTENDDTVDSEKRDLPPWPEFNFTKTIAHDPFAQPSWIAQEESGQRTNHDDSVELAALQQQGASIVLIAEDRKLATIGKRKIGVGDLVEGYTITDITTDGIILNKLDPR